MQRRSAVYVILCSIVFLLPVSAFGNNRRVIILGFDGMDYKLTKIMLKRKELIPNLHKLMNIGSFKKLRTTAPPQSPVAWSTFITGSNPGKHGIFDFIARDQETYSPLFSMSRIIGSQENWDLLGWVIPISTPKIELLRKGIPFWQVLGDNKIQATIMQIPVNFPPAPGATRSISGMGTPDMLGTYGIFSYYTDGEVREESVHGGKIFPVNVFNGQADCEIEGPENALKEGNPTIKIPFTVYIDKKEALAKIVIGDQQFILKEKEWSSWISLNFHIAPFNDAVGMVRFYLKEAHPNFGLYMSPINIDPENPPFPIGTPDGYSKELSKKIGKFYTQGIAEDTGAFNAGVLTADEFLEQSLFHQKSREKIFDYELSRFENGVLFCYFSSSDLLGHMFWRFLDPQHPNYDAKLAKTYRNVIINAYKRLDVVVGKAMEALKGDDTIIVMSDHGFGPFRRSVNLNTWLKNNGYLKILEDVEEKEKYDMSEIDWDKTMFYSLGLNSLYTNLKGREGRGIVQPKDKERLEKEVIAKLIKIIDPKTGENILKNVYRRSEVYSGKYLKEAPDMILGYNWGYRNSWESALGETTKNVISVNKKEWGGDHCIEPSLVPGVIFTNKKIRLENPGLEDLAPTILTEAGAEPLPEMEGKYIF